MRPPAVNLNLKPLCIIALATVLGILTWATSAKAGLIDNEKARNRAEKALRAGDFERAEQIYREILSKDDHDTEARLGLSHGTDEELLRETMHRMQHIRCLFHGS